MKDLDDKKNPSNKDNTVIRNNDATRVKSAKANNDNHARSDETEFKPRAQQIKPDATRIAPARRAISPNSPVQQQSRHSGSSQYKVLKDRFLLEKVLGVGGMGIVYKASDRLKVEAQDRDPYVAIKVLSDEFKSHPEAFISLQRESRKSQRIAHPNTVKVYDFDRDGDTVFMTMEYMDGKPLDQLIRQYKATGLPRDDGWEIIDGMCSALIHAHAEKIVHSDFKPGNVFIIGNSMAKIFDFGIARAVANVDSLGKSIGDKTVFDAGNLGALTPAYASLEMLQGETPDVRDDIYALGCVVYEILTGEHPYNKVPADEAYKQGLKLKKISNIKKYQWKAIEKSLSFKRENRTATVEQFYKELTYVYKPGFKSIAALFVFLTISIAAFIQFTNNQTASFDVADIRDELEYKIRLDLFQSEITKLIKNPTFSIDWEENIWTEYTGVSKLLDDINNEWLLNSKNSIYELYIAKVNDFIKEKHFARVKIVIDNGYRYTEDRQYLELAQQRLLAAIKQNNKSKNIALNRRRDQEIIRSENKVEAKKRIDSFNLALKNVNQQLICQGRLNMRDFDIAIKKLRSLDRPRYKKLEKKVVNTLAACITQIGKLRPERAAESKKYAIRLFKNKSIIAAIKIAPRDACDTSIAGLGARGKRTICRDKIRGSHYGPSLVVIPGKQGIKPFAVGKYEVSVKEMNIYCSSTRSCEVASSNNSLPATNIKISTAKSYLKWLSKNTRQKYRLPSKHEWVYAATSKRAIRDPNRNCQLSSRGISKGNELVKTTSGKQNSWGVVNYLGNAREWVYGDGRQLIAMGGSYKDAMDKCDFTLSSNHSGQADTISGFRVLREIKVR
ncbi:MAG: bifunctional serine/threonine-protein kinase/formylglycine-generating enzyme family protein [Woeseiaceae bacterium]